MAGPKRFVYILKSIKTAHTYYVGVTVDVEARLKNHNEGRYGKIISGRGSPVKP